MKGDPLKVKHLHDLIAIRATLAEQRRTVVLVTPTRIYSNR